MTCASLLLDVAMHCATWKGGPVWRLSQWGLACSKGSSRETRSLSLLASSFLRSFWTRTLRLEPRSLVSRLRQIGQRLLICRHFRMQW